MTHVELDILEESVEVPSPRGRLMGVLAYPFAATPARHALIVGPHPLMGGRIENNVVRAVGRGLAEAGFLTLRFRFADDGVSPGAMEEFWKTGRAPEDASRVDDALVALEWLRRISRGPTLLVGYSFGASVLGGLLAKGAAGLVLIGPTLAQHDFALIAASAIPKLIVGADNDFATPLATTSEWFALCAPPKQLVIVPAAEHFYRGQEDRIVKENLQWMPQ